MTTFRHFRALLIISCASLLLVSCNRSAPPKALDAETAREALLVCLREHRWDFGPFGEEKWEEQLRTAPADSRDMQGMVWIGAFWISLESNEYEAPEHDDSMKVKYGHRDSWRGRFVRGQSGKWIALPPAEVHTWYGPKKK